MDEDLVRGELPQRLTELLLVQAEVVRAAGPWMTGELHAPVIQLKDLADRVKGLIAVCEAVGLETNSVYREIQAQRLGAEQVLGRWSNTA